MTTTLLPPGPGTAAGTPRRQPRLPRLLRGPDYQPAWARPALLVLLGATAVLYLWGLGASGNANSFYAAAVQAGTQSWKALFFGSLDSSNFITVDKPPASLWVMALSGRVFGFSSWSMLVPQALEGVAAVGLLYGAVRRWAGPGAGLFAGAALAVTPAAALMFRYNNPDALLTLLLVAAAYATVRAVETASTRWLLLAGTAIGFGFLTKMLQAFLVVPALALVYLVAAPARPLRRLWQLLAAGAAIVVSAGWWVAAVELWPASSRPYVGGSTTNSVLDLTFGYNGLSRLFGNGGPGGGSGGPPGGGGGPGGGAGFGGATGITRMFSTEIGTEVSWLLPAALLALVAGLWVTRRRPRTDRTRAGLLLWGGWLLVTGLVFSYMQGIFHPYYTVALAPAIGATLAVGGRELWLRRDSWFARTALALIVAVTGAWGYVLLARTPDWHPELRYVLVAAAAIAALGLLVGLHRIRTTAVLLAVVGLFAAFSGTTAYAVSTAATAHNGPIPNAGPNGTGDGGLIRGGPGAFPGDGARVPANGRAPVQVGPGPGGGRGGPGERDADPALVALLKASSSTWAAATVGSQSAAPLELASGKAVLAIGGFSGGDPAPTLAQFQQYVAAGRIHHFVTGGFGGRGGPGGGPGGRGTAGEISAWVQSHFTATTVGGQTVYDLTASTAG